MLIFDGSWSIYVRYILNPNGVERELKILITLAAFELIAGNSNMIGKKLNWLILNVIDGKVSHFKKLLASLKKSRQ